MCSTFGPYGFPCDVEGKDTQLGVAVCTAGMLQCALPKLRLMLQSESRTSGQVASWLQQLAGHDCLCCSMLSVQLWACLMRKFPTTTY